MRFEDFTPIELACIEKAFFPGKYYAGSNPQWSSLVRLTDPHTYKENPMYQVLRNEMEATTANYDLVAVSRRAIFKKFLQANDIVLNT